MRLLKLLLLSSVFAATSGLPLTAQALSLKEAVRVAIETNPEIGQAIANREATEWELQQALGLYAPRVDLEASVGAQLLDTPSRRAAGIEDDPLYPAQVGFTATWDLLDGGFRDAEVDRQAARIDSASFRVLERSEIIGLEVARLYFEILLQGRIVQLARNNVAFHQETLSNVVDAISSGQLTEADRQQATERLASASAQVIQAQEALEAAKISFARNVGAPFTNAKLPPRAGKHLPRSLAAAVETGINNNPRIRVAGADVDAASALVNQAEGALGPRLSLEGRTVIGSDHTGTAGYGSDLSGKLVLRWNIFDGGIKSAKVQESIRRESEALLGQQVAAREVEEAVKVSWDRIHRQNELAGAYANQLSASDGLVSSYREQFTIGQRSLLDVLDAQNTRFNVQVQAETASFAARFAEYRLLAATGSLLAYLDLSAPSQSDAYARDLMGTPSVEDDGTVPERDVRPLTLLGKLDLSKYSD
jgi:adhesin transport system outer membrane protein